MSNMDMMVTVQGTKLRGMPPKPMGVVWWSNDDVMVCYVMNGGARVSKISSKNPTIVECAEGEHTNGG